MSFRARVGGQRITCVRVCEFLKRLHFNFEWKTGEVVIDEEAGGR